MKKLVVITAQILLIFILLPGCQAKQGSVTESPIMRTDTSAQMNSWNLDYATVKYDSTGQQSWVAHFNGPGNAYDQASAIAVDKEGNVYVTGSSMGSRNGTQYDCTTAKYNKDGKQIWIARHEGELANAIAIDYLGNVFVISSRATIKYDKDGYERWAAYDIGRPQTLAIDKSGNIYVTGISSSSPVVIKYDQNGKHLWKWEAGYTGRRSSTLALALDQFGNVYVAGYSQSESNDNVFRYCTIKLDAVGNQVWVAYYDGPAKFDDRAYSVAVDGAGNVYITGRSIGINTHYDYDTVKYDSTGNQLWVARYDGPANRDDLATSLSLDSKGEVYVTGYSDRNSSGERDYATVKYDTNGNQLWVARYSGLEKSDNMGSELVVDVSGNAYVTGKSKLTGDNGSNYAYATVMYDSNGHQLWAAHYNGPGKGFSTVTGLAVDIEGNVYVTGSSPGLEGISEMTQSPYPNIKVYQNQDQTIYVKIGDEFAFGFDTFTPGGQSWNEKHDDEMLSLLDKEAILRKPEYPSNSNTWFLFKALKAGKTQITFTYSFMGGESPVYDEKMFSIEIK
jgi:hypothetical protein